MTHAHVLKIIPRNQPAIAAGTICRTSVSRNTRSSLTATEEGVGLIFTFRLNTGFRDYPADNMGRPCVLHAV